MKTEGVEPRSRGFVSRHRGAIVAMVIVGALLALQWPVVKGMFYRVAGPAEPTGDIKWRSDFKAALAESKATGKPLLLDFSASWCPPCQTMKHEVWLDKQVGGVVNASYIPVLVDLSSGGNEIADRYGVSSIPTVLVLDGSGNIRQRGSYMSRSAAIEFLKRAASQG